jgi:hypothetical protein
MIPTATNTAASMADTTMFRRLEELLVAASGRVPPNLARFAMVARPGLRCAVA